MKLDAFHCALLVAIVLLAVYVARDHSSFEEGITKWWPQIDPSISLAQQQQQQQQQRRRQLKRTRDESQK